MLNLFMYLIQFSYLGGYIWRSKNKREAISLMQRCPLVLGSSPGFRKKVTSLYLGFMRVDISLRKDRHQRMERGRDRNRDRDRNRWGQPWWLNSKESTCQCRRQGFNPWVGKTLWRKGDLLQYSCLEISRERGTWWAAVHGATEELDTT